VYAYHLWSFSERASRKFSQYILEIKWFDNKGQIQHKRQWQHTTRSDSIVIFTMCPWKPRAIPDNLVGTNVMIKGNYVQLKLKLVILALSSLMALDCLCHSVAHIETNNIFIGNFAERRNYLWNGMTVLSICWKIILSSAWSYCERTRTRMDIENNRIIVLCKRSLFRSKAEKWGKIHCTFCELFWTSSLGKHSQIIIFLR
jgi:hypothetical protein